MSKRYQKNVTTFDAFLNGNNHTEKTKAMITILYNYLEENKKSDNIVIEPCGTEIAINKNKKKIYALKVDKQKITIWYRLYGDEKIKDKPKTSRPMEKSETGAIPDYLPTYGDIEGIEYLVKYSGDFTISFSDSNHKVLEGCLQGISNHMNNFKV